MLSKSQARLFFVGGTAVFSLVFLWLTVDTISQTAARSNEKNLTAEVIEGKEIWDKNNCMGCHTLLGEGAYYAPELTKVYERRGEAWMRIFLKDPQAMFPGQRKMVQYNFTDEQITRVIAFLKWVGEIDANGFPQKPDMVAPSASSSQAMTSVGGSPLATAPAMFGTVCQACHSLTGKGGTVGPALDGVANRFTQEKLDLWLKDPQAVKPGTAMPNLGLSDDVRAELVTWLMTLR